MALKEQADIIQSVQNDTSVCPAAPALCGALDTSQLDLNVDFNEASDSFLKHSAADVVVLLFIRCLTMT